VVVVVVVVVVVAVVVVAAAVAAAAVSSNSKSSSTSNCINGQCPQCACFSTFRVLCYKPSKIVLLSQSNISHFVQFYYIVHKYKSLLEHRNTLFCRFYGGNHVLQIKWLHDTICGWL
jgi:hypothetical protein